MNATLPLEKNLIQEKVIIINITKTTVIQLQIFMAHYVRDLRD